MNSNTSQMILEDRAVPLSSEHLATCWREFVAGMHFLLRYGRHNDADKRAIACDNLRLLQHSLRKDAAYRGLIETACQESGTQSLPTARTLRHDDTLQADLISLPAGCHLGIADRPDHFTLFLILNGEAMQPFPALRSERQSWWRRGNSARQTLRSGEAFIAPRSLAARLVAASRGCVVLRTDLSVSPTTLGEPPRLFHRDREQGSGQNLPTAI